MLFPDRDHPWKSKPLRKVFRLSLKGINPREFPHEEFHHYSIPAWDETGGPVIEPGKAIESGKLLLAEPCVLVSKLNPQISRVRQFCPPNDGRRACASTEIMPFVPLSANTSISFYSHYFGAERFRRNLVAAATGTTNSHQRVRPPQTLEWIIPFPPPGEQAAIARVLDAADTSLQRTRKAMDEAKSVKRAILQEFFYEALGETAYADRPRKKLPSGWELVSAEQLIAGEPKNGVSPRSSSQPPGILTFSIAAIREGRVDLRNEENLKYAQIPEKVAKLFRLNRGDLLIVRGNANPDLVGKAGIVDRVPEGCIYPDITKRVVFRTNATRNVSPEFAVLAWNHPIVHNQVLRRAKTSNGTLKINNRDVKQIVLPVPPDEDQRNIVKLAAAVDAKINSLEQVFDAQGQLKRALMHDLLTGRVRVNLCEFPQPFLP